MSRRLALVSLAVIVAVAMPSAPARAGGKVKAELLCGTYVDDAITGMVPSPKQPKLTDPIACALHVTSAGGQDGALTVLRTYRYVVDPATGKKTRTEGTSKSGDLEKGDDGAYKDLEAVWQPNDPDADGTVAFRSCEDFDVVASVGDAAGTYFTRTVHVAQRCPKPKAMKATTACFAVDHDDQSHPLDRASLGDTQRIVCRVTSADDRLPHGDRAAVAGVSHFVVSRDDGTTAPGTSPPRTAADGCFPNDAGDKFTCDVTFPPGDWSLCTENRFDLVVTDPGSGAALYAKTIKFAEICGE